MKNKNLVKIAPSILSADFTKLGGEIRELDEAGADYIHVDVMDGHFVPNISFGALIVKAIRPLTQKTLDVHLMIAPVDAYLEEFAASGADIISIHAEAGAHTHRSLQRIKNLGKKAGIVFNPATPLDMLPHIIDDVDLILLMSVNPGFGGQSYISIEKKIEQARKLIDASSRDIDLEIDGGINKDTAKRAINAGANVLVAGTSVFKHHSKNYKNAMDELRG